jgi:hypothetical protein
LPDVRLNASAANRADDRTIVTHQHLGGLEGRD